MVRSDEYQALIERLNDPQNAKRKEALSSKPNGHGLVFHFNRINAYREHGDQTNTTTVKLLELDYCVSLREANRLMDELGWK